jgi:hypothetical protein
MSVERIVAGLLCLATLAACTRLLLWHRAAAGQSAPWRLAVLMLLQPVAAGLLFLALFPPAGREGPDRLRIATAGTGRTATIAAGPPLILLPEAEGATGGERMPDLATALRRYRSVRALTILGSGLEPRDLAAAAGLSVRFDPPALAPGILHLAPPPVVAPGARFTVAGALNRLPSATVELLDPAGRVTDRTDLGRDGRFVLAGTARAAGQSLFRLRVLRGRRMVEEADVPVQVADGARPRLLILAGAPGAEVKYLRRWASDAGYDVTARMSAGGGVTLGDAPVSLDAASLRRFDVAIVDDRSWAGARAPLIAAARAGMGLVLRAAGPIVGATRSQWQALGFGLGGKNELVPLALPRAAPPAIAGTRQGIGKGDAPVDVATPDDYVPEVSRIAASPNGRRSVPMLRDAAGRTIAAWAMLGSGRVALFTGIDSYALTLTGRRDLYGDWWTQMLSTVIRPAAGAQVIPGTYWTGERATICDLPGATRIAAPDGTTAQLLPVAGCAGYWPTQAGWHIIGGRTGARALYVRPTTDLPVMRAARNWQATAMLGSGPGIDAAAGTAARPVDPRLWWLGWLAVSALLWWFERSRLGRRAQSAM